ncbi:MAG: MoaD/ThiS family protein [Pseudomonadota bacterium]
MEITVGLTKALVHLNSGRKEVIQTMPDESRIAHLMDVLEAAMPGIKSMVFDSVGAIADSINIYVNGDNIRYLKGVDTILADGDKVNIIPAAAAG